MDVQCGLKTSQVIKKCLETILEGTEYAIIYFKVDSMVLESVDALCICQYIFRFPSTCFLSYKTTPFTYPLNVIRLKNPPPHPKGLPRTFPLLYHAYLSINSITIDSKRRFVPENLMSKIICRNIIGR